MSTTQDHVFISYARKERHYAERLEADLRTEGFPTWRDARDLDSSQDFSGEIETAIRSASHVVVCLSKDVVRPDSFVKREIAYALAEDQRRRERNPPTRLPIIPVLFSGGEMPLLVSTWTYVPVPDEASYPEAMGQIIERLRGFGAFDNVPTYSDPPELVQYLNDLHQWASDRLQESVHLLLTPGARELCWKGSRFDVSPLPKSFAPPSPEPQATVEAGVSFSSFFDAFEAFGQRAVLLGKPGAGKTVALLALARNAAVARLNDPTSPIPLLAHIHTWDYRNPVAKWAVGRTGRSFLRQIPDQWFLYLMDGLDELLPPSSHSNPVEVIRMFVEIVSDQLAENVGVVVTCRLDRYLEAYKEREGPLKVLELSDLSDEQIHALLEAQGQSWLWQALEHDESFMALARKPLFLSILSESVDPEEDSPLTASGLFDRLVAHRFRYEAARRISVPFDEVYTRDQLGKIAVAMTEGRYWRRSISRERLAAVSNIEGEGFLAFAEQLGILRNEDGEVQFSHLYFQWFFALPGLSRRLRMGTEEERNDVAYLLVELGQLAGEELLRLLRCGAPEVPRGLVVDILRELHYRGLRRPEVIAAITRCLEDENSDIREKAATTLANSATHDQLPALLAVVERWDVPAVLSQVALALGKIGDPIALHPLLRLLRCKDISFYLRMPPHHMAGLLFYKLARRITPAALRRDSLFLSTGVRVCAAEALGLLGCREAVGPLLKTLEEKEAALRSAAAKALGVLKDPVSVPSLAKVLAQDDLSVRSAAALALGRIGGSEAVAPLLRTLLDPKNLEEDTLEHWQRNDSRDVYRHVRRALWEIGVDQILKANDLRILFQALQGDQTLVKIDVAETLGWIAATLEDHEERREEIVSALAEVLRDPDQNVRDYIAKSLKIVNSPSAVAALERSGMAGRLFL